MIAIDLRANAFARLLLGALLVAFSGIWSGETKAAYTDCPSITATQTLILDLTIDQCFTESTAPPEVDPFTDDYISIQAADNAGSTGFNVNGSISYSVSNGSTTIGPISAPSSDQSIDCSTGCTVTGTSGINFVYSFSGGTGSVDNDPDITVTGNGTPISSGDAVPSTTDDTDFGNVAVSGGTNVNTFTIQNNGAASLNVTSVSSSDATQFAVSGITTPASVGTSSSTTFTVTFEPTSAGTKSATITIASDDPDTPSYTFAVQGTGTIPDINVTGNATTIPSGDVSPTTTDGTDFGEVVVSGGTNSNTFTIQNNGTGSLSVTGVSSSDATQFAVSGITTPASVGASSSTTFTVTFDPTSAGTKSATITIASDDPDTPSYTFTVEGTGTNPDINVTGNATTIPSGDVSPTTTDGTDFGDVAVSAGTNANTFTIQNNGTGSLNVTGVSSSDATQFAVSGITTPASVGASSSTTFTVTFDPASAGAQSATITIASDDPDTPSYTFAVQGAGTTAPSFSQQFAPDTVLPNGTSTLTFTIDNSANASSATSLAFTNNLPAGLTVASPSNAATTCTGGTLTASGGSGAISLSGASVGAGASCTVNVDVTAASDGSFVNTTGDLTSSLGNSGTSTDTLTVASPEIDVQRPAATSIADEGTDAQGSVAAGVQQTLTYTIENTGTATLTISGTPTSASENNVSVDSITAPGSGSLAASATTTFTVLYTPTVAGAFSFEIDIVSDDADEANYDITVSGTATGAAEIAVSSSASGPVGDGGTDTVPGTPAAGAASTITYTITNAGTDTLTLTEPTVASNVTSDTNVTVNGFTLDSTTVAAGGGTTTLQVSYTPAAAGAFGFDFNFANDDADENPYDITVSGTASGAPEIALTSSESGPVADGGTDTVTSSVTQGTAATVTYTITNSGTDTLTISAPTVGGNVTGETNVTVNNLALDTTSVSGGGGTATLDVTYTAAAAGAFGFVLSLSNNDGDENPYEVTVSGTASSGATGLAATSGSGQSAETGTQFASPLVATVTDSSNNGVAGVDVTFTAPATGASLTFASTGTNTETVTTAADGTATSSAMTANSTGSGYQGGGSLEPYLVTASSSGLTSVTFSLTNDRNSDADIQKTKEVIASFVTNRANTIVSGQPDIVSRLTAGTPGGRGARNGLNFDVTRYSRSGSFRFSLRDLANAVQRGPSGQAGERTADGPTARAANVDPERYAVFDNFNSSGTMSYTAVAPQPVEQDTLAILNGTNGELASGGDAGSAEVQSGWDFWAQGTYAVTRNNNSDSTTGLFFAGVDYRYQDRAVFGLMGQLDIADETNSSANTAADGVGWMAGPYAVLRLHQNFYLDGAVTYGQSYNNVNALGLFEDDFRTQRFLLQGGLTGDFKIDEHTKVSPFARVTYYFEEQESYTDTLGRLIPSQDFDLGRIEFGPKLSWDLMLDDRLLFSPFLSLSGIYDFNKLQDGTPTDATLASADEDLRARLEAGAGLLIPSRNIRISGEGFYDGIGADDFESYGVTLNISIPF